MIPKDMSTKCLLKKTLGNERQRAVLEEVDRIYAKSRLSAFITHESERTHRCNGTRTSEGPRKQQSSYRSLSSQQPLFSPIKTIRNQTLDERT